MSHMKNFSRGGGCKEELELGEQGEAKTRKEMLFFVDKSAKNTSFLHAPLPEVLVGSPPETLV